MPVLKWIDMDKGQLEYYSERPSVSFPAALIGLQITRTHKLSHNRQRCDVLVTVRLAMDFTGNTSHTVPKVARDQSLAYLDITDSIYDTLQGWHEDLFNPLERQALREERRPDGYKVIAIPFTTSFIQDVTHP